MKSGDKRLLYGTYHYYEGGKKRPASPEEEEEIRRKASMSKLSLMLLWVTIAAGILYFLGMMLRELGDQSGLLFPFLAGIWIVTVIFLGTIIYGRKMSDAISGRIIGGSQHRQK